MSQLSELQQQLKYNNSQCVNIENRIRILKKIEDMTNGIISNVIIQFKDEKNALYIVHQFEPEKLRAAVLEILETRLRDITPEDENEQT